MHLERLVGVTLQVGSETRKFVGEPLSVVYQMKLKIIVVYKLVVAIARSIL